VKELRDDAVVLRTYRTGESDRVVVLWTRGHGKVRVLAKGARRATSRLGGSLEVGAHVRVDLVATRGEFFIVRNVEHLERMATARSSYERITAGTPWSRSSTRSPPRTSPTRASSSCSCAC
jgi:DNA repair protein RecO (recombination protein O)